MTPAAYLSILGVTDEEVRAIQRCRDRTHKQLMRSFPPSLGEEPRAAVGLLWALLPRESSLVVQSAQAPERPFVVGTPVASAVRTEVCAGGTLSLRLSLACQKTPPSPVPPELRALVKEQRGKRSTGEEGVKAGRAYRSKPVTVPEGERTAWFAARMSRIGLAVDEKAAQIGPLYFAIIASRRGRIPYVNAEFVASVVDPELANEALRNGVGSGRTYGLGLLLPSVP